MMNEKEYNKQFSKNLRRIALEKDKTQADIAKALNVSKATVSLWFNGRNVPRMDKVDAICKFLNVTRSELMEGGEQSREVFVISADDVKLLTAFRESSEETQNIIRRILGLKEKTDTARKSSTAG